MLDNLRSPCVIMYDFCSRCCFGVFLIYVLLITHKNPDVVIRDIPFDSCQKDLHFDLHETKNNSWLIRTNMSFSLKFHVPTCLYISEYF